MRYATDKTQSISYRFDLEAGKYNVYVGMFDPSSWWDGKRYADISLNDKVVTEKYNYQNNVNDTLTYENVEVGEEGTLTITISPNAATSSAVQVSFIVVAKAQKDAEVTPTPELRQVQSLRQHLRQVQSLRQHLRQVQSLRQRPQTIPIMRMTRTTTPRILLWQQPQLRFR